MLFAPRRRRRRRAFAVAACSLALLLPLLRCDVSTNGQLRAEDLSSG